MKLCKRVRLGDSAILLILALAQFVSTQVLIYEGWPGIFGSANTGPKRAPSRTVERMPQPAPARLRFYRIATMPERLAGVAPAPRMN